ncbi:dihydropteroate synthase-like protein [Geoglobus ahangari]
MKVLLVTGRLAESIVKANSAGCDVYVADVDVAAFITEKHLSSVDISRYDLVLVPGLAKGRWRELEERTGTKVRLGPIHAYDIPKVMERIGSVELSHEVPADRLIDMNRERELVELVESVEKGVFDINGVEVGGTSRMKVVAEIVDATELDRDQLVSRIEYYLQSGADIIDLGVPLSFSVEDVRRAVKVAKDCCDAVSVDTFSPRAIRTAVESGVDMVMSISEKNIRALDHIEGQAVVVVERNVERLSWLVDLVRTKTEKVIADPVLDMDGFVSSVLRYAEFRRRDPRTPVLFGAGNVTELFDADSIGVNALLALIAEEVGASLLFTTEASPKTRGSIRELRIASYMVKGARLKGTPPKDLGMSLLVLKEKVRFPEAEVPENCQKAVESKEFHRDPLGDFRIWISGDRIVCSHEKACVHGKTAKEIIDTVLRMGLVSRLDHAGYLGRELKKAEIALKLKKNYVQDEELNFGYYERDLKDENSC